MKHTLSQNNLNNETFELVLQTLTEGLFLIDKDGKIIYSNKALQKMTGLNAQQLTGKKCCSIMADSCTPPPDCTLYAKEAITNTECRIKHQSGTIIPVLKNARVLRSQEGEIIGAVETLSDLSKLKAAEQRLKTIEQSSYKKGGLQRLIGESTTMQEVYNLIELAAASNSTILISGETGTGKELVADAIHSLSDRSSGPLIKVNCSALPETLLESELFGHTKGAFTGAVKDKAGRFELANGGTLFLDEIGELSPLIQIKLLRFLQDKSFERLGEGVPIKSDVRIIAATNRNLRKEVKTERFREDLFYRLKVFPIHLPPLRERKEDLGILTDHFISKFRAQTGKNIFNLKHQATVTLMDYCWPGNVRELEHAIEHAFVSCQKDIIDTSDLPLEIRMSHLRRDICTEPEAVTNGSESLPPQNITEETILKTLEQCKGNKSEAARRLGVDRSTIWRKLRRMKGMT
ncbi:sigma 54-interacting transcriptional regulator [Chitinispirillales bacterium ANBcel5]|uniref:sigma-54 interaction domain-containing protein n=1 Tax=Cellulosispirillum alkaliphilum TaxID=3039283 RepID=UPI002A5689DA|nr:sigma 54-interacting transcriptional regulator [Chitinispirillales bacterium ANBcel5]